MQSIILSEPPPEFVRFPHWVLWSSDKRPWQARFPSELASHSDPDTWGSYAACLDGMHVRPELRPGFVFSKIPVAWNPYAAADFDDCFDHNGMLLPTVEQIVRRLDSYCERSVRKRGLHVFVEGELPENSPHKVVIDGHGKCVEVYDRQRFFATTFDQVAELSAGHIVANQGALDDLVSLMRRHRPQRAAQTSHQPRQALNLTVSDREPVLRDNDVLTKVFNTAQRGAMLHQLWLGRWSPYYETQNSADARFVSALAYYCNGNGEQIDRLYRRSGLMRAKWDEPRGSGTYATELIEDAVSTTTVFYDPKWRASRVKKSKASPLERIVAVLPGHPPGLTEEEIKRASGAGWTAIQAELRRYGQWGAVRGGSGKKADPWRFWLPGNPEPAPFVITRDTPLEQIPCPF